LISAGRVGLGHCGHDVAKQLEAAVGDKPAEAGKTHVAGILGRPNGMARRSGVSRLAASVFVTYGGLDAFCNVVAAVAETHTPRDQVPAPRQHPRGRDVPSRTAGPFRRLAETLYRRRWYIEVRRLRNVINYGAC